MGGSATVDRGLLAEHDVRIARAGAWRLEHGLRDVYIYRASGGEFQPMEIGGLLAAKAGWRSPAQPRPKFHMRTSVASIVIRAVGERWRRA